MPALLPGKGCLPGDCGLCEVLAVAVVEDIVSTVVELDLFIGRIFGNSERFEGSAALERSSIYPGKVSDWYPLPSVTALPAARAPRSWRHELDRSSALKYPYGSASRAVCGTAESSSIRSMTWISNKSPSASRAAAPHSLSPRSGGSMASLFRGDLKGTSSSALNSCVAFCRLRRNVGDCSLAS